MRCDARDDIVNFAYVVFLRKTEADDAVSVRVVKPEKFFESALVVRCARRACAHKYAVLLKTMQKHFAADIRKRHAQNVRDGIIKWRDYFDIGDIFLQFFDKVFSIFV